AVVGRCTSHHDVRTAERIEALGEIGADKSAVHGFPHNDFALLLCGKAHWLIADLPRSEGALRLLRVMAHVDHGPALLTPEGEQRQRPRLRFDIIAADAGCDDVEALLIINQKQGRRLHAASVLRASGFTRSGGVASSTSMRIASFSGMTRLCWLPKRRIETVRSSASRLPTTSSTGTLANECSRTL